jgi:hypothetical protein
VGKSDSLSRKSVIKLFVPFDYAKDKEVSASYLFLFLSDFDLKKTTEYIHILYVVLFS